MPNEFLFRDGRLVKRIITESDLGSADLLLASLVEPVPTIVPDAFFMGEHPVHMATSPQSITLAMRIPHIPFSAQMELSPDGKFLFMPDVNYFNLSTERREAVTVTKPYTPPLSSVFNFYARFNTNGTAAALAMEAYCLMRAQNGSFYAPYYPNIYDNGLLCMGADWEHAKNQAPGLMQRFMYAYNSFMTTKCSSHLINQSKRGIFNLKMNDTGDQGDWQRSGQDITTYGQSTGLAFATQLKDLL